MPPKVLLASPPCMGASNEAPCFFFCFSYGWLVKPSHPRRRQRVLAEVSSAGSERLPLSFTAGSGVRERLPKQAQLQVLTGIG